MIKTLSTNEMINELLADEYAGWTYDEAEALVNFYEDLEDQLDEVIEFDPVSIRCDWTSSTPDELCNDYGIHKDEIIGILQNNTYYIELSSGDILYQPF